MAYIDTILKMPRRPNEGAVDHAVRMMTALGRYQKMAKGAMLKMGERARADILAGRPMTWTEFRDAGPVFLWAKARQYAGDFRAHRSKIR
jgi:hypothetical protein